MSTEEADESLGTRALDILESVATGLPAPVKKSAVAAFKRLCVAGTEVPASWLEGKAAEIRAASDARVRLTMAAAEQIADSMDVPTEFAVRASTKFAEKIIKGQRNIDRVAQIAAEEIAGKPNAASDGSAEKGPSEDWLDRFAEESASRSSDDVRQMFGRILAGEIRRPGSFSIRAIRTISELDPVTADLFAKFAACTMEMAIGKMDSRVCDLGNSAGRNGLLKYDLPFGGLVKLQEAGLVQPELDSSQDYSMSIVGRGGPMLPFSFQGGLYYLGPGGADLQAAVRISGPALTMVGAQLIDIVDRPPQTEYRRALFHHLRSRGYTIIGCSAEQTEGGGTRFRMGDQILD